MSSAGSDRKSNGNENYREQQPKSDAAHNVKYYLLQQQFNNFNQMAAMGQLVFTYTDKRRGAPEPLRVNVSFDFKYNAIQISFDGEYQEMPARSFDYVYFSDVNHVSWGHWTPFFENSAHPPAELLCFSVVGKQQTLDVQAQDADMAETWVKGLRALIGLSDDECNEMAQRALEQRSTADIRALNDAQIEAEENKHNEKDLKSDEIEGDAADREDEADVIRDWWAECVHLPQHQDLDELLIANGYSSPEILAEITENELEILGVSKAKHRRRIMRCLPLLKTMTDPEVPEHKNHVNEDAAPDVGSVASGTEKMTISIKQRDTDNVFFLECTSQRDIAWLRQAIYEQHDIAPKHIVMLFRNQELSADNKSLGDYAMADSDEVIWFARNENGSETSATSVSSSRRSTKGFEQRFEELCGVVQAMQASIDSLSRNVQDLMMKQGGTGALQEVRVWLKKTVGLPQYERLFIDNGFDDLYAIKQALSMDDLKTIGIRNFSHRQRILRHARKIKVQQK